MESGNFSGEKPKASTASAKSISTSAPAAKPAAYRPPHAKNAASFQAEVYSLSLVDFNGFL